MEKFALLISYDGTGYCGWQKQAHPMALSPPSIQQTIEDTIERITEEKVPVVASGRTDSGVHASGQVAHFVLRRKNPWEVQTLFKALNSLLPRKIRILQIQKVPESFHAQRSAEKKQYSYYFHQGPTDLPSLGAFGNWVSKEFNLEKMRQGAEFLLGEHDFKAFQASGSSAKTSVRRILEVEISERPVFFPEIPPHFRRIRFRVVGNGFLKQMVRTIAGTLLEIGLEKRAPETFLELINSKDRSLAGVTAPARGLWLEKVWYPEFPMLQLDATPEVK